MQEHRACPGHTLLDGGEAQAGRSLLGQDVKGQRESIFVGLVEG